jgi:hypothetical protein
MHGRGPMAVTTVLGPRRWRYALANRSRNFTSFPIPAAVVARCRVAANTKRDVVVRLSTGRELRGFCTVTCGTALNIPARFRAAFRAAAWFECVIVGGRTAAAASLRWVAGGEDDSPTA